jgi:hypothetical protein
MIPIPPVRSLAAVALLALVTACGKDEPHRTVTGPAPDPGPPVTTAVYEDSLRFFTGYPDLEMGTIPLVCCGLYDPGFVNENAMRIVFYDPANIKPRWEVLILVDRAQQGEVATLPTTVVSPSHVPRISMFVATQSNEFSSDAQGSSGTITVHSFHCTSASIQIDFSIDATIHSEYWDGGTIQVKGTFRGTFPPQSCS